jgi:putative tricarboxylic transport membrane protein
VTTAGRDMICGVAGLAIALAYYALADALPVSLLSDEIGAAGVPKSLAIGLGLCSILLVGRAAVTRGAAAITFEASTHARALGITAIGAAYAALAPLIGYAPAVALLIAGTALYFGTRLNPRLIVVAVLGAALLWALFVRMLGIPMPDGMLQRILT